MTFIVFYQGVLRWTFSMSIVDLVAFLVAHHFGGGVRNDAFVLPASFQDIIFLIFQDVVILDFYELSNFQKKNAGCRL